MLKKALRDFEVFKEQKWNSKWRLKCGNEYSHLFKNVNELKKIRKILEIYEYEYIRIRSLVIRTHSLLFGVES